MTLENLLTVIDDRNTVIVFCYLAGSNKTKLVELDRVENIDKSLYSYPVTNIDAYDERWIHVTIDGEIEESAFQEVITL